MAANNFGLFFTREGTVVRLPVNPAELPAVRENDNSEYNVLGVGPIMIPRTPKLREVTVSSFFPGREFPGVLTSGGFEPPEFYMEFFSSAMEDGAVLAYTPVRYYENGEPFFTSDTGMDVLVTGFTVTEKGGETGDFYYELSLTEYRDYSPRTVEIEDLGGSRTVTSQPSRSKPRGQLTVGSVCIANGSWYYTSYGDEPHGSGNGRRVVVSRMVDASRARPVHVDSESGGPLGWMRASDLEAVE